MTTPGGELLGEARIEIEADTDPAVRALQQFSRDAQGRIRDVRGRFVAESVEINRALAGIRLDLDTDPATRALTEFTLDAQGRLRDLRGQFARDTGGIRDSLRDSGQEGGSSFLAGLTEHLRQIPAAIGSALSAAAGAAQQLGQNPYVQAAGVAIAAGIATVAVPLIGALISAATISVAGLGVIGLGAVILKDEPQVKAAADRLVATVKGIFDKAAKPLIKPFTDAIKSIEQTAKELAPQINAAFALAAPFIAPLVDGLERFAKEIMPGLLALLRDGQPVFDALGDSLGIIGEALGDAFKVIGAQGPEAGQALRDVARVVAGLILGFGLLVAALADAYGHVRRFVVGVIDFFQRLYDKLVGNSIIPDLVNDIVALFAGLPGRAVAALAALGGALARVARAAFQRFRDAASERIGSILNLVRGLPGRVSGALGDLGSRLYRSGQSLIQGFIDGILDKLGDVRAAASSVAEAARDFFGFSPAKEGPLSGKGWTLYSGQAFAADFAEGIVNRISAVTGATAQLTTAAALPVGRTTTAVRTAVSVAAPNVVVAPPAVTVMVDGRVLTDKVKVLIGDNNAAMARQLAQGVRR